MHRSNVNIQEQQQLNQFLGSLALGRRPTMSSGCGTVGRLSLLLNLVTGTHKVKVYQRSHCSLHSR